MVGRESVVSDAVFLSMLGKRAVLLLCLGRSDGTVDIANGFGYVDCDGWG